MGTRGKAALKALTPCNPSARRNGVPASSQSKPALIAMAAVERASSMSMMSRDIWMMVFMNLPATIWIGCYNLQKNEIASQNYRTHANGFGTFCWRVTTECAGAYRCKKELKRHTFHTAYLIKVTVPLRITFFSLKV